MEEKVLIKGEFSKSNIISWIFIILGIVAFFISLSPTFYDPEMAMWMIISGFCFLIAIFFWLLLGLCAIEVSNKRVCGKAAFGRRVDLPLDKISAVGTSILNGISVATSSGRITFYLCKNRDEVFNVISELLLNRQNINTPSNLTTSNADELKKYKDLLDNGIITQEEFAQKKKQLLGL